MNTNQSEEGRKGELNWTTLRQHWAESAKTDIKFGTEDELRVMLGAVEFHKRLKELGWNDAVYCPKDGSYFIGYSFGWRTPGLMRYTGDWPTGGWWMSEAGDEWPVRPSLWRPLNEMEKAEIEARRR